ncbi:MAG: TspO/MBR family protein [Methanobacteriota archaeon]
MKKISVHSLSIAAVCIITPLLIGFIGSLATMPSIPIWYAHLNKPWFSPPNWVFGPVWTLLYILMGVSLWLVIRNGLSPPGTKTGFLFYIAQLLFNLLWSFVFFGMQMPGLGLLVILILFMLIVATMVTFRKISRWACILLIPYLCWVGFATILNAALYVLN